MDIYNTPSEFGLEIVGTVEFGYGYEYDLFVVWKNQEDQFGWARSAGCSCNSPFEYEGRTSIKWGEPTEIQEVFEAILKDGLSYKGEEELGAYRLHFMEILTKMVK